MSYPQLIKAVLAGKQASSVAGRSYREESLLQLAPFRGIGDEVCWTLSIWPAGRGRSTLGAQLPLKQKGHACYRVSLLFCLSLLLLILVGWSGRGAPVWNVGSHDFLFVDVLKQEAYQVIAVDPLARFASMA